MEVDRKVKPGFSESVPGKLLDALLTGERFGVQAAGIPLMRSLAPDAYERLQEQNLSRVYGGDLYQALRPEAGGLERTVGGSILGGVLDPLSYISLGGLTRAGKLAQAGGTARAALRTGTKLSPKGIAAAQAPELALSLAQQARRGQRALLHIPGDIHIRGTQFFRGLDLIQSGHAAERILNRLPHTEWMMQMGKAMDTVTQRIAQTFNFPIGVPLPMWRAHKRLMSSLMGRGGARFRHTTELMEPEIRNFAAQLSKQYNMPLDESMKKLREVITASMEEFPSLQMARDAKRVVVVPGRTSFDVAVEKFHKNFPLPFGPRSPLDTPEIARMKEIHHIARSEYLNILRMEEEVLGKSMKLLVSHDQDYVLHLMTDEAKTHLREATDTVWRATSHRGRAGSGKPPLRTHASLLMRRMRFINPEVLKQNSDVLRTITDSVFPGSKHKTNLYSLLRRDMKAMEKGKLMSMKTLKLLHKQVEKDVLDADMVGRLIPAMSAQQANEWVYQHGIGRFIPKGKVQRFFEEDPTVLLAARGMRADRAIVSDQFFKEIKDPNKLLSVKADNFDDLPQWAKEAGFVPADHADMQGWFMHPDAGRWLNRIEKMEADLNPELRGFLGTYSKAINLWKSWTLAVFPSYATRNFAGNMWNYYLGSDNPLEAARGVTDAAKWFGALRKGKDFKIQTELGTTISGRQLWTEIDRLGGWGTGFISPERTKQLKEAVTSHVRMAGTSLRSFDPQVVLSRAYKKSGLGKVVGGIAPLSPKETQKLMLGLGSPNNIYLETGFRINAILDDYTRAAHILQKVRKGISIEDAVTSAKKHLFDYYDLSPREKHIFRNVFPFYSWSRKNIPFQLEAIITQPSRVARFGSALHSFHGWEQVEDERYLNSWMKEQMPLRIRTNKQTGQHEYFMFKNWLPLADVHDIINPIQWSMHSLNPFIKVPLESIFNINFFTRRQIDRMNSLFHGERDPFLGVPTPRKVSHMLKSLRPINELHTWVDNPQEMDLVSRMARLFVGKTYPLDKDRSMAELSFLLRQLSVNYQAAARAEYRKDRTSPEISRLHEKYLKDVMKLRKSFGRDKEPLQPEFDWIGGDQ